VLWPPPHLDAMNDGACFLEARSRVVGRVPACSVRAGDHLVAHAGRVAHHIGDVAAHPGAEGLDHVQHGDARGMDDVVSRQARTLGSVQSQAPMATFSSDLMVAIVVPAKDAADTIGLVVDDLRRQDPHGVCMVVVDDGSTDGTASVVERLLVDLPWLLLVAGEGRGPAAARNLGARATSAPWLAFVDADVRLDPAWLRAGLARIAEGDCDVVEGVVVPQGGDHRGMVLHAASSAADGVFVTANLWVRREVFDRVGGYDESYRVPWREDSDLGWRMLDAGARAVPGRDVTVYHPHARRPVRALLRGGPQLDADTRLRARFPERFSRLFFSRRGFRTTYVAVCVLLALIASIAARLPLVADIALALVADLLAVVAVRSKIAYRRHPRWTEWAALALIAPAVVLLRLVWVIRSNLTHRQWFW